MKRDGDVLRRADRELERAEAAIAARAGAERLQVARLRLDPLSLVAGAPLQSPAQPKHARQDSNLRPPV